MRFCLPVEGGGAVRGMESAGVHCGPGEQALDCNPFPESGSKAHFLNVSLCLLMESLLEFHASSNSLAVLCLACPKMVVWFQSNVCPIWSVCMDMSDIWSWRLVASWCSCTRVARDLPVCLT